MHPNGQSPYRKRTGVGRFFYVTKSLSQAPGQSRRRNSVTSVSQSAVKMGLATNEIKLSGQDARELKQLRWVQNLRLRSVMRRFVHRIASFEDLEQRCVRIEKVQLQLWSLNKPLYLCFAGAIVPLQHPFEPVS